MSPFVIISTIGAYLALLFVVAWVASRRADNSVFFTGARRSPWLVAALGMVAAPMSGVTFVSVPGMVVGNNFAYLQMALGFVAGYVVIAFVLVPLYYRLKVTSIYEFLQSRFGPVSHKTGAWMFFASKLLGASLRIYLVCLVLQTLVFQPLGVPFWANATVMAALVWLYTFRGGVRSVVWTDALKTACLLFSVGLSIWFIAGELGFDFGQMAVEIKHSELSRIFFLDDIDDRRYFFKQFFAGLFIVVAMTGLDQDMMQVPLSCRSPRDSQKNFVAAGLVQFVVVALFLCLGVLLNLFVVSRGLASSAAGDELFPFVATGAGLPPVVGVVFALGLIASTWSAAGSALTALTSSFTIDILCAPNLRRVVHIAMAAAMAGVILAFRALNSTSVIDAVYVLASYTYGPLLGMFAFGIFTRRNVRDRLVPLVAVVSPLLCLVFDLNSESWFGGYRFGYEILILNATFTFAGMAALIKRNRLAK